MAKIRVGVIGAGGIGSTHLRAYASHADVCEIVGIADIQVENAREKAQQYGGEAFADFQQMLDQTRPDAISICTPPDMHLPIVQAAAQRQIAVLCEKPPARTLAETEALLHAAQQSRAILQFAFCHRFHQPVNQAQELIGSGRLGKVVQIYNRFGFRFSRAGSSWFTEKDVAGGGILIDTLVHSIDLFHALAGSPIRSVSAELSTVLPIQVEDSASMLIATANGIAGSLNCSWVTPISEAEVRIYGTEGEAVIDYAQPGGLRYRLAADDDWTQLPFDQPDRFDRQAEYFLKCVASRTASAVGAENALAVMRVIDAAYRSAQSRSMVMI